MTAPPPPAPAPAAVSMEEDAPASSAPSRLVYGSLEGALRAGGVSAAAAVNATAAAASAAAAIPTTKQPVSFNNRTALLSTSQVVTDDTPTDGNGKVLSETVLIGMAAGNINISSMSAETFALSAATQAAAAEQAALLREMEVARRARSVRVPTNDNLVRKALREIGEPITLFGERIPGRRERLSGLLARRAVEQSMGEAGASAAVVEEIAAPKKEAKAFLTPGTEELRLARVQITNFALPRTAERIARETRERELDNQDAAGARAQAKASRVARLAKLSNFCSEVGDARPVASVAFSACSTRLATASWSGISKVWAVTPVTKLQYELKGHKDSVTDIAWTPTPTQHIGAANIASCGMDANIMLWHAPVPDVTEEDASMTDVAAPPLVGGLPVSSTPSLAPLAVLSGHADRCCRLAWHPSGRLVASTSYDKTWRLWDVETQKELLKQQGHAKATYALAFHKDGSLAATGDLGGVGHLWDLRTGHSILGLVGHAKQMLAADFHPNGVHLATASDDHTVRIWDLRMRSTLYTIGAHSNLISNVRWDPLEGLYLLTSSYDQTSKIWHGTDFTLVKTLAGHEGRVMRAEIAPNGAFIATSAYDRTWKLFAYED